MRVAIIVCLMLPLNNYLLWMMKALYFIIRMLSELERKNMSKLLERYSLEHLRPSPEVF